MTVNQALDPYIPVLTEVVSDQPEALANEAPVLPATIADQHNAHLEEHAIEHFSNTEWTLLERRLTEHVLQQLQGRVDFVLEQRLRDSMEEVLQHAMKGLTASIRDGLQETIEKIVVRAVSQELAHLQTLKK